MRRWALVVLVVLLGAASTGRAADVATTAGTRSLLFRYSGLSELSPSNDTEGLGLRYFLKDNLAIRPSLSFGWSRRRTHPPATDPGQPQASSAYQINTTVQLELALERRLRVAGSISPYLGAGVYGAHYDFKTEPGVLPTDSVGTVTRITHRGTNAALFGILGFEWGWTRSFSLGGETRFGLNMLTGKYETEAVGKPDRLSGDIYQIGVGFDSASLLVSVRW